MQVVLGAPECLSYTFNEEGKVTSFTGGYIMDRSEDPILLSMLDKVSLLYGN